MDRRKIVEDITASVEILTPESPEVAEAISDLVEAVKQSCPCPLGFGDREALEGLRPPNSNFQFRAEPTLYQWTPGEVYKETLEDGFIKIQTPEISNRALVLAPDCLSSQNFAAVSGHVAASTLYCDSFIVGKKTRFTQDELNTFEIIQRITQAFQSGRPIPIYFVQEMEGMHPDEAEKLYQANYASLKKIAPAVAGFKVYSSDENDAEFQELQASMDERAEKLRQEQYLSLLEDVLTLLDQQLTFFTAQEARYDKEHEERVDYDEMKKRERGLNALFREPVFQTQAQRGLQDVLRHEEKLLEDNFKVNNGTTLFTAALEPFSECKKPAEFDQARFQASQILTGGYVASVNGMGARVTQAGIQIFEEATANISKELKTAGFRDLPEAVSPVIALEIEDPAEIDALNPSTPSRAEGAIRYGIFGSLGASIPLTAVKTLVDIEWISSTAFIAGPIGLAILFFVGMGVGIVLTYYIVKDQKKRLYLSDAKNNTRDTIGALRIQAYRALETLRRDWARALEDGMRDLLSRALRHVEEEMLIIRDISNMSAHDLLKRRERYAHLRRDLGVIVDRLQLYSDSDTK